ncbi:MAG: right-handed parallel beta-helix repeat-containing protein, partial [Candidatus Pacearchaeota archaeon]
GIYLLYSYDNRLVNNTANSNYYGVYLRLSSNNTITNSTVNSNYYGVYLDSSNNTITDSIVNSNNYGVYLDSSNNTITDSIVNSNNYGVYLASSNNTITSNIVKENRWMDIWFYTDSIHCDNIIENNTGSGDRPIKYYNYTVNLQDEEVSEIILCDADNSNLNNITVAGSDTIDNNALLIMKTDNSNITNINSSNNYYGIYLLYSYDNRLVNNTANSNYYGVYLRLSSNNTITNSTVNSNTYGIYLSYSLNNTLTNNNASSNGAGISLGSYSSNNTLTNNTASSNGIGIYLYPSSNNNTLTNNTANSNNYYGIYLDHSSNNALINNIASSNNYNGIYLVSSSNNTITNNTVNSNNYGVFLSSSANNTITNNTVNSNNWGGIYLYSSQNNTLTDNAASLNIYGIGLSFSSNNTLANNTANSNWNGIRLSYSSNNTLANNIMNNNTYNFNMDGSDISHYYQDINTSNTVDGKPIYYWTNEKNAPNGCTNAIIDETSNAGFVGLISCNNITVKNLDLSKNSHGILLINTTNSNIINNIAQNNEWDFYSQSNSLNNTVINFNIDPLISFESKDIALKNASYQAPPDPANYINIGKYIEIINNSADSWIYLNVSYNESEISNVIESTLRIWKHNGTWYNTGFYNVNGVDTANNIVYANITSFSVFAPLGVQALQIFLNEPANNTQFNNTQNINFNFTAIDYNSEILNCSIYLDNIQNQTNSSVKNNTLTNFFIQGISYGNHSWFINCTDGVASSASEIRIFNIKANYYTSYSPMYFNGENFYEELYTGSCTNVSNDATYISYVNGTVDIDLILVDDTVNPICFGPGGLRIIYCQGCVTQGITNCSMVESIAGLNQGDCRYFKASAFVAQGTGNDYIWNDTFNNSYYVIPGYQSPPYLVMQTPPTVPRLYKPDAGAQLYSRIPNFEWYNSSDAEGDIITYDLLVANSSNFISNTIVINVTNITEGSGNHSQNWGNLTSYEPINDLPIGTLYWKVRAYDGKKYSGWSATRNFTILSSLIISLPINSINFSSMLPNEENDTTDNTPPPIIVQNDGNVIIDIIINGSDLWLMQPNPTSYYQYKIGINESGSFNENFSTMNWTNMSATNIDIDIADLKYKNESDTAEIEIKLIVPSDEPPGSRDSIITITAEIGE